MAISKASRRASEKLDEVRAAYHCHDHQHAIAILTLDYPELLIEVCDVLIGALKSRRGELFWRRAAALLLSLDWQPHQLAIRLSNRSKQNRTQVYHLGLRKGDVNCASASASMAMPDFVSRAFRSGIAANVVFAQQSALPQVGNSADTPMLVVAHR